MMTLKILCAAMVASLAFTMILGTNAHAADPFAEPERPPITLYDGTQFQLSKDYPSKDHPCTALKSDGLYPWQVAIKGKPITVENAALYAVALKAAVATNMRVLLYNFENWNAAQTGWYNQPWLGSIRDGIHGTYQGSTLPAGMFPISGLTEQMTTHVLVYYDACAAISLDKVWGTTAMDPGSSIETGGAQFAEGALIVKPAFTTADASTWPPMEGAMSWGLWNSPDGKKSKQLFNAQFFQFDIIVKDSLSSPETQWVFMTLVYDKDAPGTTNWEKMVPLGAMWGNDPDVNSPMYCSYVPPPLEPIIYECPTKLSETWINPAAPYYAKETLGWGGRLSGPNDGAVDIDAYVLQADGSSKPYDGRYAMSSCMGCHGSAEYQSGSFLLPSPSTCAKDSCGPTTTKEGQIVYYPAGGLNFMKWFQNRSGDVPMNEGNIALDYGMNFAVKALPAWFRQTDQ